MSRTTNLALNRKFEEGISGPIRREKPIVSQTMKVGECIMDVCLMASRDIFAGPGMTLNPNSHKKCRKAARK